MTLPAPTRAAALAHLADFTPHMGTRYAKRRNTDYGPGRHGAVSCLSPHIRRRLVAEDEVIAAALAAHGPEGAEKFIQEVVWRSYFKGWLEQRPTTWDSYRDGLERDFETLAIDRKLRAQVQAATEARSGLACFDAWASELLETGYLHNHARMWFASIWIFTFGLPWRVGADFFLRNLLDGDPASNTLGWRWVAGLHTRGKTYAAQAWNIAQFTDGRFAPREADLAPDAPALVHEEPDGLPSRLGLRAPVVPDLSKPTALLLTEEDCTPTLPEGLNIVTTATLAASHLRSPEPVGDHVAAFERAALHDTVQRLGHNAVNMRAGLPGDLAKWAAQAGARQIVTPFVPRGPLRDWLNSATPALEAHGITLAEMQRDWDRHVWPHATAGFFKVKTKIPSILGTAGLL
ncbi:MAG: FAD binding domain of DNA photolyase [Roseibaca calidilacus]|uniref:Deoxyribodipyrimidine photo-lyase n=1 Tax=Roseibaca calidilacus TaxID=1666912 RepID=A0A0P7VUQ6_9RHOB|nr:FAD-binding domain-containing protein [Roseibaca calidilacus]KPP90840.1 MAG: FAD binding domain of DNA photolyase [Roseibaca calidilacus]CUX83654.1 deoxyribodipyrimidine photo-lyase [Roseibaca calidilacus]